ncbi:MAG TPA: hypothetical protein VHE36_11625 [Sphingomicrobium sp.]|jgi:hypothetical protein|nr:hypothetical protein [Sphingomicrobium sp.]
MLRSVSLFLGLAITAPALAANYSATPAQPASGRFIARDITWSCGAAACQGATAESRPVVLCQGLAKQVGRIETFLVDGRAFTPTELERCNASAKPQPAKSLAQQ